MEESAVSTLELLILVMTATAAAVGIWSIHWARRASSCWRGRSGRVLFVTNLLVLGGVGAAAALARAQGLPLCGLVAGMLVVGITWDGGAATHVQTLPEGGRRSLADCRD
jgi:hypothetical protein